MSNDTAPHPHPDPQWSTQPIIDWLFSEGRLIGNDSEFVLQFSRRLSSCCAPVERVLTTILTLNPEVVAASNLWLKSTDMVDYFEAERHVRETDRYIGSPLQHLFDTGKRVRQRLDDLPGDAHLAYTELADDGFTDYLALPVMFAEGLGAALILSTKRRGGFSEHDIANFRIIRDYLTPIIEVHALRYLS